MTGILRKTRVGVQIAQHPCGKPTRLQIQAYGPNPKRRCRVEGSTASGRRSWTGSAAAGEPNRLR